MKLSYCPFCLSAVQSEVCPYCGRHIAYTGDPMHLPVGHVLNGAHPYVLGASLGQGGFGITYIALDIVSNRRVAIKEYFPTYCAGRNGDVTVASYRGQEENFYKGKERFLDEARMLKRLSDLGSVVDVLDFFEINNSAYFVMEYLEGSSLKSYVEQRGKIPAQQFLKQLKPLMADMEAMHQRGVVHRDIAPDNIIMLPDGRLKLIDFGAARSYLGDKSMTVVVKKGFAPVEQYMRKGSNACTDVYALAATIYYCITGVVPPDSAERQYGDATLCAPTNLGAELTQVQELALEKALEIQPKERTQSIAKFIEELKKAPVPAPDLQLSREKKPKKEKARKLRPEKILTERKDRNTQKQEEIFPKAQKVDPEKNAPMSRRERKLVSEAKEQQPNRKETKSELIAGKTKKKKWIIPVAVTVFALVVAGTFLFSGKAKLEPEKEIELGVDSISNPEDYNRPAETKPAQTAPEEQPPAATEPEKPVSGPELTGEESGTFPFNTETGGNITHVFGENLKVMVKNYYDVTVTLSGLNMKDQYELLTGTKKDQWGYEWSVRFQDGNYEQMLSVVLSVPQQNAKFMSLSNAQGRLEGGYQTDKAAKLENAAVSYTEDSITWKYTMDDNSYFNFQSLDKVIATVKDPSSDLDLEYTYQRDSGLRVSDLNPDMPSLIADKDSDLQPLIEEELTFKSQWITPVRTQEGSNTPIVVQIMDKPVNNCSSMTAEITVEEGTPREFAVFIKDMDRWREVGRIPSSGGKVTTGTITYDKPTSFNYFAIAPVGDSDAIINYKLTTANVYGYGLQSNWSGKTVRFTAENLDVVVSYGERVSVTLRGLSLQDEMPSKIDGPKGTEEYRWNVKLTSGNYAMTFQTDCPVPVIKYGQPKVTIWKEMKHTFDMVYLEFGEDVDHFVKRATPKVTHTGNSITWEYTLDPNQPFDFSSGIFVEVNWFDRANNTGVSQTYFGR